MTTESRTVLFVDLLGFSNLTLEYPTPILTFGPDKEGFSGSSYSPSHSVFTRFHGTLEWHLSQAAIAGDISAMVFSDCAYVVLANATLTATFAVELMQHFCLCLVPVRMGVGYGTFNPLRFTLNIHRSMFSGSGIVTAYEAERAARGLRIFIHPAAMAERPLLSLKTHLVALSSPTPSGAFELDYLYDDSADDGNAGSAAERDQDLMRAVYGMREDADTEKADVAEHYGNTIAALEHMRRLRGRPEFWSA